MTVEERAHRIAHKLLEERLQPVRLWWLSFADPDKPKGQRFLGVCIVEARGPASAMLEARRRGCNPGGEIENWMLPDTDSTREKVGPYMNRLLSKDEVMAAGFV